VRGEVVDFYDRLFRVLRRPAVRDGEFGVKAISGSDTILAWKWAKGDEHVLVAVNFSPHTSGGDVVCEDAPMTGDTVPVVDLMDDVVYPRDPNEMRSKGLCIVLGPFQGQIMSY
jgi:hypothetical protein